LGQRLIEDAERMRKMHATLDVDVFAASHAPGGAGKIAEPVDGDHNSAFERRDVKSRGQMSEVVFDVVNFAPKALAGRGFRQKFGNSFALAPVPQTVEHEPNVRHVGYQIADLAREVGAAVLIDGNMIQVGQRYPCFAQTISDGLRGKSRPML